MKKSILVVDDDAMFRTIIRRHLDKLGFHVIENQSGTGVIEQIQTHAPAACIIDMVLNDREGLATIQEIQTLTKRPKIIASSSNPSYLHHAEALAIDGTLLKPVSQTQLRSTLTSLQLLEAPAVP
jgi:CheY-like chemotaxis protein